MRTRNFSAPDLDQLYDDWQISDKLVLPDAPRIVVAGAFEGRLMRLLAEMYPHNEYIVGYEPQQWAAESCIRKTVHYNNAIVIPWGLLADKRRDVVLPLGEYGTDACSMLGAPREQGEGMFSDAYYLLDAWTPIDLFIMNMEGFEYRLLEYLAVKEPEYIRQFAVQFHTKYEKSPYHTDQLMMFMEKHYGKPIYYDYPRWVYWGHAL